MLEERDKRNFTISEYSNELQRYINIVLRALNYPSIGDVPQNSDMWNRVLVPSTSACWDTGIELQPGRNNANRDGLITEHVFELQSLAQFIRATITGLLRSGNRFTTQGRVDPVIWEDLANKPYGPPLAPVNGEYTPFGRMWNAMGTSQNTSPFVLADKHLNEMKGRMWKGKSAIRRASVMQGHLDGGTFASFNAFINELRRPIGVLTFLTNDLARLRARTAYRAVRYEMWLLSQEARRQNYAFPNLHIRLDEWMRDQIDSIIRDARAFIQNWRTRGRNRILDSGVQDEDELLEALAILSDAAEYYSFDFTGWFGGNPSNGAD
jgi:hypothetical protein